MRRTPSPIRYSAPRGTGARAPGNPPAPEEDRRPADAPDAEPDPVLGAARDRREGAQALRGEHDPEATAAVLDERPEARQLGLDPRLLEPAGERHRRHVP